MPRQPHRTTETATPPNPRTGRSSAARRRAAANGDERAASLREAPRARRRPSRKRPRRSARSSIERRRAARAQAPGAAAPRRGERRRRPHQRSRARLPARDGAGLAAHARGRGRDREAHRGRAARAPARRPRNTVSVCERSSRPRSCCARASIELRGTLDGLDEIEPTHSHEERRKDFLAKAAKVKRLEGEIVKKLACVAQLAHERRYARAPARRDRRAAAARSST